MDNPRIEFLTEAIQAFWEKDTIDAVGQATMFASHMHFAITVLHHTRHSQHNLTEGRILALRCGLDLALINAVGYRPQSWKNATTRLIQMACNGNLLLLGGFLCVCLFFL
ncbi:hypothetical protein GCM10010937_21780 [Gluconobacter japonicus]|uniref:Uncharacterized protein n=1 Tax=Gluconobacter japonicus TaxID=376620 RepID=A0ABQ5WJY6_GLUJA|nr:hypothetical protein GCM10010937_21780 [Gluconobacter japonicus]